MSTANAMTNHKLEVVRTLDGMESPLIKHLTPASAQEQLFPVGIGMYAGRCVSRASDGSAELGCAVRRVPYFLFRNSMSPSTGSASSSVAMVDQVGLTTQDGATHKVLAYAGIEGMEMATTEYIVSSGTAYALNQFLKAPAAASFVGNPAIVAGAGMLTNHQVVHGKDMIVGIVSESAPVTPHQVPMLKFYTLFRPPVEGLPNGFAEPTWL